MTRAELLGQALAYAAAGWPVFPTRPDNPECPGGPDCECKRPFPGSRGCRGASASPRLIRAWWQARPDANVAVATGSPGPDVLDVDVKPDGSGFAAFNRLKEAGLLAGPLALVRTPSGGLHAYYLGTGQPNGKLPRHHLDFRGDGGYVLAPPSRVHGKPYELLGHRTEAGGRIDWQAIKRLLDPPPARPRRRRRGSLASLAAWVGRLHEGDRNDGLFWAACQANESGHDDLGALVDAAVLAGLSEAEARRTVTSAARRAAR
jgi:Bifunctional DNA primase/polymerase, N-terminal